MVGPSLLGLLARWNRSDSRTADLQSDPKNSAGRSVLDVAAGVFEAVAGWCVDGPGGVSRTAS